MIHVLRNHSTTEQLQDMLQEYMIMIKIVVDIRKNIYLAAGGNGLGLRIDNAG
ncbi:MAG: hypothetical protein WCP19_13010 [Chloroflexota bacterium]